MILQSMMRAQMPALYKPENSTKMQWYQPILQAQRKQMLDGRLLGQELVEGRLIDLDVAHRLQPLSSLLLPLQQLLPSRYVARM